MNCGVMRGKGAKFCSNCGNALPLEAAICVGCGADARSLGTQLPGAGPASRDEKSKVLAGVLGILFGGLGVHRFYLGYTTIGIVQVVVTICTFGIGAIWGTVEGIVILCGGMRTDAAGRPLGDY